MIILYDELSISLFASSLNKSATNLKEQLDKLQEIDDTFASTAKGPISEAHKERTETINKEMEESIKTLKNIAEQIFESNDTMRSLDQKAIFGFQHTS